MDNDPELERVIERTGRDPEWLEREMIARALAGDTKEARDVLARCAEHALLGTLSVPMRNYLHDRLREVVDGIEPSKALRIARPASKPRNPFPDWEAPLAAFAALAHRRQHAPEKIDAMDEARQIIEGKSLCRTQAQRIRATYKPMRELTEELLLHLMMHRPPRQGEPRSSGSVPRFAQAIAHKLLALLARD